MIAIYAMFCFFFAMDFFGYKKYSKHRNLVKTK